MNFSSANVDTSMLSQRQLDFVRASSRFQRAESMFNSVNFNYLSSEDSYLAKQFEQELTETAYNLLSGELSRLRLKQKSINNTDLVSTANITLHEAALKETTVISRIEGKISSNQAEIVKYQQQLNVFKASPEIIKYQALTHQIKGLRDTESGIIELMMHRTANGEDTSSLEKKLEDIRKKIEEKEHERAEFQPNYDEMKVVEDKLNALLQENTGLINERRALDPQLVRFEKVDAFFDKVLKGNGNGLGVDSDISKYRTNLSETQDVFDEKSVETISFQELLNNNLALRNSVKADLDSSKSMRELKQNLFSSVSKA